jgi:hypothetical protein
MMMKPTLLNGIMVMVMVATLLALAPTTTTMMTVYAQTAPPPVATPGAPSLEELTAPHIGAGGEFVTPIIEQTQQACGATVPQVCVELVYASGNIVVLTGEVLPEL